MGLHPAVSKVRVIGANLAPSSAAALQAAGDPLWWRSHEAALLAVGGCAEPLLAASGTKSARFDLHGLLTRVAAEDLNQQGAAPLLAARALWLAAR